MAPAVTQFETEVLEFPENAETRKIQNRLNQLGSQGFQVVGSNTLKTEAGPVIAYTLSRPKPSLPQSNLPPKESVPRGQPDFDGCDGDY